MTHPHNYPYYERFFHAKLRARWFALGMMVGGLIMFVGVLLDWATR